MTQVIIKTETAEEMRKVLAMARKSNVNFEAVTIKKKPDVTKKAAQPAIGKVKVSSLSSDEVLDQKLALAMDQGRTGQYVDEKKFMQELRTSITILPGKPATDAELVSLIAESESGRGASIDTTLKSVKRALKIYLAEK